MGGQGNPRVWRRDYCCRDAEAVECGVRDERGDDVVSEVVGVGFDASSLSSDVHCEFNIAYLALSPLTA